MTRIAFAIPGDLATRTGGYGYARELLDHLPACGIAIRHCVLPGSFPHPGDADVSETIRILRATAREEILLIDGLAFGALPAQHLATLGRTIVALVHHPLGYETGLSETDKQALIASERAALAYAAHVIVSSGTTRDALIGNFGVAADSITIAEPGTTLPRSDPSANQRESGRSLPPCGGEVAPSRILAIGSVVPRKGFDILIEALAGLRDLDWHLRLVGSLERAPETARALRAQIAACELASHVDLTGEFDAEPLATEYAAADLFVLSSHYEGYGMVLAEAMAYGLPIITTTGGAAARTVPDEAALKVPPGDATALAKAIRRAICDAPLRGGLAAASLRAGQSLPRWPDTVAKIAAALRRTAQDAQR